VVSKGGDPIIHEEERASGREESVLGRKKGNVRTAAFDRRGDLVAAAVVDEDLAAAHLNVA
jgi:hypothetical protein